MNIRTKAFAKGGIAAMAAGAMAFTATPALADDHYDDDDGISAGDVIAGAVIIGGIAAIAGAIGGDDDRYYRDGRYYNNGRYYNGNRWGYRGSPRGAVKRCVAVASDQARRHGYSRARVTEIRDVDDTRGGWRVKGRIVVDDRYDYGRYNRYDRYDRYDRNDRDRGSFTCYVEGQRVAGLDFDGVRGLR